MYHVKRQFEDRYQILKANGPLLLTVLQDANTPRYMNVNRLVDATSDDRVVVKTVNDIVVDLTQIGLKGSPTKVKATFNKEFNSERNVVEVNAEEAVELIIAKLKEKLASANMNQVKNDVLPFVRNPKELDIWSNDYFLQLADMIMFE